MELKEAREKREKLENSLNYKLNEKEILFRKTQPQAVDTTKESVQGGKREDKHLNYVQSLEEKQIDSEIDKIYAQIKNLDNWIENELKILGKYNELEQLIIFYKEQETTVDKRTGRIRELTWDEIGKKVHYSGEWCRKIYRVYKRKRDV